VIVIETYYLIDYENVGKEGFSGCEKLTGTDYIHLFYTENNNKIDLDILNNHGEAAIITHKVAAGKQSADIHLSSYLGYFIGINQGKECSYIIISKDTDFDKVIEFWKAEKKVKVSRAQNIKQSAAPAAQPKQQGKMKSVLGKEVSKISGADKIKRNGEVQKALSQGKWESKIINDVASLVVKNIGTKNGKQQVYHKIVSKYGQEEGLKIYNCVKKYV